MDINNHLDFLRRAAYSLYGKSVNENIPLTKDYLKKEMDCLTGKTMVAKKLSLFEFIEKYIAESENRTNPKTGLKISYRSIQEYNTTLKNIKEFQEANDEPLDWLNISVNTFKDFRDYLTTEKNYAINNTAKHVDNFRQFLRGAKDEKFVFDYSVLTNKKITHALTNAFVVGSKRYCLTSRFKISGTISFAEDLTPFISNIESLLLQGHS